MYSTYYNGAQQLDLPGNIITIATEIGRVFLIDGTFFDSDMRLEIGYIVVLSLTGGG